MIRAVVFDLDGTLINSLPAIADSLNRVLKEHDLPTHSQQRVRTFIGDGIAKLVERAMPEDILDTSPDGQSLQQLITAMMADYADTWHTGTHPYSGVEATLQSLLDQGTSIAVFSNKPDVYCKEITDRLFPTITFTKVLGQREGVPVKPDPAGAYHVAESLDIDITQIAYLGDSTIDVHTARNAGMLAIAASWGYHDLPALEATQPDHLIDSIEKLLPIITP